MWGSSGSLRGILTLAALLFHDDLSMNLPVPDSARLADAVQKLLRLIQNDADLKTQCDCSPIRESLRKAIAPTFEIVFAGAFSAGKSMLINALLGRELLYSAEGHATGTECQIAYAEPHEERVILTFLSRVELVEQAQRLCQQLGLNPALVANWDVSDPWVALGQQCSTIIQQEGGESKSERAKQASALRYLTQGALENARYLEAKTNATLSMEALNFQSLQDAAGYTRRGSNSAVLKRVEYYCHDALLRDGNILIDTPGIDAPVKRDAELTYRKIEHPDTSAVVCVLKSASAGDLTTEETELIEKTSLNSGVRDRVFYVFNRVDEAWYNPQLRQRLERLIDDQFQSSERVYQTSALLGFYGSQIQGTSVGDRFGLDSVMADSVRPAAGSEETPLFVSEFNRYCASSGKLPIAQFRVDVRSYESPNQNYVRILQDYGADLIAQLIQDSGIETFKTAITRYLTEEKRPRLLATLVTDLQPVCTLLSQSYRETWEQLRSQPQDVAALQEEELRQLSRSLKAVGAEFHQHIEALVNEIVASEANTGFENDFRKLKARLVSRLDELLNTFSVGAVHQRAQASHRRNSVVPLLGILAEAFYYLANGLEDVLVEASQELVHNFFQQMRRRIRKQDYSRQLTRLFGNDTGIEAMLKQVEQQVAAALVNEARTECDRYVRERPEFFMESTASIFQLRQTLQQACQGYDYRSMIQAEPAIRQLLKLDFEEKVRETVMQTFRQTINQTLNIHLLAAAGRQEEAILQQYDQARDYLRHTLAAEAETKIRLNQRRQAEVAEHMAVYNQAVAAINQSVAQMVLDLQPLPGIEVDEGAIAPLLANPETPNPETGFLPNLEP
jgi:replication fork clamp-binding protein CrfC